MTLAFSTLLVRYSNMTSTHTVKSNIAPSVCRSRLNEITLLSGDVVGKGDRQSGGMDVCMYALPYLAE